MHIYPLSALFGVVCLFVCFVCLFCLFVLFVFFSILLILILHCLLLQTFRRPQFRVNDGERVSSSVCLLACLFVRLIADFVLILCLFFCVCLLSCRFYFGFVCVSFTFLVCLLQVVCVSWFLP